MTLPITTDFGLLSTAILIGVFFYTAVQFRSPLGIIFGGLTAFSFVGYLNDIVSTDVLFIAAFLNVVMLTIVAIHSAQ